uniref:Calponin-homology (CH) domain-containing protein n=1 Tax=Panagrolaimus superbus TaxID=310955 RepID=A0A914YQE4_9BILA
MAFETTVITTDVIEVPAEAKTIVINPPSDGSIVPPVTTNGDATVVAPVTTTTEAETPVAEKPEEKKVVNPREDPVEWIKSLIPAGVHKVNHQILSWIQDQTYTDETQKQPLPGKNESVTKTQFINFLKDGTLLANFANALSPGSIEKVYEGEEAKVKENQKANLQNFVNFAKEKAGFTEAEAFAVDDLQENGKSGYNAVFNTLFQLGMKAQEKFNATGIDVENVMEAASTAVKNSIIQTIWNFFKRVRPQLKSKAETSDEKTPTVNGANGNGVIIEETPVSNVVPIVASNGDAKVVEDIPPPVPTTAAPAVAAQ